MNYNIPVNKPFLPPKSEFEEYVDEIWGRNWLTNNGPLVREFESEVADYLEIDKMIFVNNGTTALQIAIKALGLHGEIITTPYSYVATTNSILWQDCQPVFVDIDQDSLNIDATKIEESITDATTGILATHVYGNPCDVELIQNIAQKNNLKIIYDAAHCFGVRYKGSSIFNWGDISITSFHATKVFHTVEGGGLFTGDDSIFQKMKYLMNFGHDGPYRFKEIGINGKNTEFHAAMGICNLKYVESCLEKRKKLAEYYDHFFEKLPVERPKIKDYTETNYSYYPILFESSIQKENMILRLKENSIETRSYFNPSLNKLSYVGSFHVPISESVADRVLCLPFYFDLSFAEVDKIISIVHNFFK